MRHTRGGSSLAWAALLLCAVAAVAPAASAQLRLPQPVGYVNDFANIIPEEEEARIVRIIEEVRGKSGGEIAVVTLPSLEGRTTSEVALQILREWGVGASTQAGDSLNNTGTVILVAPTERQSRIEVGYGTNTFIPAAEAGRIQDEQMLPSFREGDYGRGILLGVTTVAQAYSERFGFELTGEVPEMERPRGSGGGGNSRVLFYIVLIILLFLISGRGGRGGRGGGGGGRRRRFGGGPVIIPFPMGGGWGGGGFGGGGFGGGGFGGFGGGSGGGGGAGRGW